MSTSFKLAMCQVETEEWALDANLERAIASLKQAKEDGADFAVCPECVIHAYPVAFNYDQREEHNQRVSECAEALDGPRITALKDLAKEIQLDFVLGFAEKSTDGNTYNTAALFGKSGNIENMYRKVHCRPFESTLHWGPFTPGEEFSTYTIHPGEVCTGTFICFDRERTETFTSMRHLGAEFIACPLATDTSRMDTLQPHNNEALTQALAACNETYITVVNHAGRFNGGSFLIGPDGACIHQMDDKPGVAVLDVDIEAVRKLRKEAYGWRGYGFTRNDIYQKYIPG